MSRAPDPVFDDLFREVILDHYRRPRNRGALAGGNRHAEGLNPTCGDEIILDLRLDGGVIGDIAFGGQGCSISQASASMLTERVKGRSVAEANDVQRQVRAMLLEAKEPPAELGDLEALQGVSKFPVRVKCALLCWNVLHEGLNPATVNTKQDTQETL